MSNILTSDRDRRQEKLSFQVDAGLLVQLGEQLVARRSVALAEIIKNSYDADATVVNVLLENVKDEGTASGSGLIIIEDNGVGMTSEQVRHHWMRIATADKMLNPISPVFGRPRTGAKGVGRFATRRLANRLTLHSVAVAASGVKERTVVSFNWADFQPGDTLDSVQVDCETTVVDSETPTGVMLYLEDIRDRWSEDDIAELRRDILSLVTPFPESHQTPQPLDASSTIDPGFFVRLETPEFPKYGGGLGEQFLAGAWAVLAGQVDEFGVPHYSLNIRSTQEEMVFTADDQVFLGLVDVSFRLHYFVYRSDYFEDLEYGVRDAQRMGREQGGVRVYLDGFRVFPYGDAGDDWLQLDERRAGRTRQLVKPTGELSVMEDEVPGRSWLLMPGNNQVFGAVEISRLKHPGIVINISRERLVENEAFKNLQRFVQLGIYWMTIQYARVKASEAERSRSMRRPSALELINRARDQVQNLGSAEPEATRELLQVLSYAHERAQTEQAALISELSMYRVLTSLGATIAMFNHLLRAIIDGIRAISTDLRELGVHVSPEGQTSYQKTLSQTENWHYLLESQVKQFGSLLGKENREERHKIVLHTTINNVVTPLTLYMREFSIEFCNEVAKNVRTPPMYAAELHAILLHTLTNALKAVRSQRVRKIAVRARLDPGNLTILMLDTGTGIAPDRRDVVFRAFETSSTPDPILGEGTGLGLKAVKDIVDTYGGTVHFIDPDSLSSEDTAWKTCIEIILPRRRGM